MSTPSKAPSPGRFDRVDWIALHQEEALDPQRRIIDPHHHLWDYPQSRYLAAELLADTTAGHRVTDTVFVECTSGYNETGPEHLMTVGETRFVAEQAASLQGSGTQISAIVGTTDLSHAAVLEDALDAHVAAGAGLFRGIRHAAAYDASPEIRASHSNPPAGLMRQPAFIAGVNRLGEKELSFDAWLFHPQLPELAGLADDAPGTTIILDHLGAPLGIGPYRHQSAKAIDGDWRNGMTAVAACPNVVLKVGGIGMDDLLATGWSKQPKPPTSLMIEEEWGDRIRWCIDLFGADRCMFESNFPVDRQSVGYTVLWNAFQRIAQELPDDDQNQLFSGTASRVYRI